MLTKMEEGGIIKYIAMYGRYVGEGFYFEISLESRLDDRAICPRTGLVAMYDFEGSSLIKNVCDQKQFLSRLSESKGTKPTVEMDAERDGHVLHLSNCSFVTFPSR